MSGASHANFYTAGHRPLRRQDEMMSIMASTHRKVKLARREPTGAVYRTRHAPKPDSLWRDIVAGTVFTVTVLLSVGVVLAGGLIVFG